MRTNVEFKITEKTEKMTTHMAIHHRPSENTFYIHTHTFIHTHIHTGCSKNDR